MKTRFGFVSNSSSSSFVCVMDKNTYDNIIGKFPAQFQNVIDEMSREENFMGNKVILLGWGCGNADSFDYVEFNEETAKEELKICNLSDEEKEKITDEYGDDGSLIYGLRELFDEYIGQASKDGKAITSSIDV